MTNYMIVRFLILQYWLNQKVEDKIFENLLMTNTYLMALIKKNKDLDYKKKIHKFF